MGENPKRGLQQGRVTIQVRRDIGFRPFVYLTELTVRAEFISDGVQVATEVGCAARQPPVVIQGLSDFADVWY